MPTNLTQQFKPDISNEQLLDAIRKNSSPQYQSRIPSATKAGVKAAFEALVNPNHRQFWNEFESSLVNRIGLVLYRNLTWTNPLAKFKVGQLNYGDTIEEIMVGLLTAKTYDPSREYMEKELFGTSKVETQTSYHQVSRTNMYSLTVNEPVLQQAFLSEGGLASYIAQVMAAPTNSDNVDEFLLMCSLFELYDNAGGFFNIHVDDISAQGSTAAQANYALRRMREMGAKLPFMSRLYNAAGMPAFANADELELFITPEAQAALDVEALAGAFNIEKAQMPGKTTVIPRENFGISGAQALITTKDFFVVADTQLRTESQWNPVSLQTNYFLHHWQIISASRFVPCVLFSTRPDTPIVAETIQISSVTAPTAIDHDFDPVTTVMRGQSYGIEALAVSIPADASADEVILAVTGQQSSHTYVTQNGTLYVGADETAETLTIRATSAYTGDDEQTATSTLTVDGDILRLWPNPSVTEG